MAQGTVADKVAVIGGSAGSLDVILTMLPDILPESGCAFIVVVHRKADNDNLLTDILKRRTVMQVREVEDKEHVLPNVVYIAPADYHLLLEDEHSFSLDSSEKVNYSRPSIDVTFESVAEHFGSRAIGILLSGANADGATGLKKIKEAGGVTIVQAPLSADVSFMPQEAINLNAAMHILRDNEIAQAINNALSRRTG